MRVLGATVAAVLAGVGVLAAAGGETPPASLWGTYRPHLYFGLRPQLPESLLTALAWYGTHELAGIRDMRYSCADTGGIDKFTWTHHDGRSFGVQEIVDQRNNYRLETSFLKTGSEHASGGNWVARIRGTVLDESRPNQELATLFYVAGESDAVQLQGTDRGAGGVNGSAPVLGGFSLHVEPGEGTDVTHRVGRQVTHSGAWNGREVLTFELTHKLRKLHAEGRMKRETLPPSRELFTLAGDEDPNSNAHAVQLLHRGNFSFDVFYEAHDTPAGSRLDGHALTAALAARRHAHEERFERTFRLQERGFPAHRVAAARELTAQLLGGVGYFYGSSLVDRSGGDEDEFDVQRQLQAEVAPPQALLTGTPSRSVFPRGFYWDEGFHLAHIGAWDGQLALEILERWTALIDDDGWVAREQILGDEARAQVPPEFQVQNVKFGNPPTLILGLLRYLDGLRAQSTSPDAAPAGDQGAAIATLHRLYPAWRRHYNWFRRTQRGEIKSWGRSSTAPSEAYRWRGRTRTHVLTSGLDDYPRAEEPHVGELHVDLHAWMGFFAEVMRTFAEMLGLEDDVEEYERHARGIAANVIDLHWSDAERMFCDAAVDHTDESVLVCHRGYVSLFPMLLQLLPAQSEQLGAVLHLLRDRAHLWSEHGLRSLSKSSKFYGTDENYWRGAIWIPINYLALRALHNTYMRTPGPHQTLAAETYKELRTNVINTVLNAYEETGYSWEQYDPEDGHGRRGHPFTGWTSTVVLMMAEEY